MKWIPNALSSLRIAVAIVFPFVAARYRLPLVALALLTEYLDGALARRFKWESKTGQLLDPVADKLFVLSAGITFVVAGLISWPVLLLVSFRDMTIGAGFLYFLLSSREYHKIAGFRPHMTGKLTTVFQYLLFFDILVFGKPHVVLVALTGCLNIAAVVVYCRSFAAQMRRA